jgi:DNA-binding transcriptional LysR family regulator
VLNIVRLRVLRELYHRKTLSAVAEALSYSTSAVSQQVRLLEKEIGTKLVEPSGRRLQLTAQGMILVAHAEKILDLLELAEADVSMSLEQPRGMLKIAAFQSAALTLVPLMVRDLKERHPQLTLEFHQGEPEKTLPALQSAEYDLVVAESYPGMPIQSTPGLSFIELFEDPLWLAMDASTADSLDHRKSIITQLADAGWAVEAEDSVPRTWVINECRKSGFDPRIVCSSEDLAVQLRFVETGVAVAVLPGLALHEASANIRRFPIAPSVQSRQILLACREASSSRPAVRAAISSMERASAAYATGGPFPISKP